MLNGEDDGCDSYESKKNEDRSHVKETKGKRRRKNKNELVGGTGAANLGWQMQ